MSDDVRCARRRSAEGHRSNAPCHAAADMHALHTAKTAVSIIVLLAAVCARATPAPHLRWTTMHTPCCDIHAPSELRSAQARVAAVVDECVAHATAVIGSGPRDRIQVVLHDVIDSANGSAEVTPYDHVDLRMIQPDDDSELAASDDWLRMLVQHEVLHVAHLDAIGGIPALVDVVIGRQWAPNLIQPRLFVEGLATFTETRFTSGGRLRSTMFLQPLRIAARAHDLWSLDDASNASRRSPGGGAAYLYGAAFVAWLAQHDDATMFADIAQQQGAAVIPYDVQRTIEAHTHRDLATDWTSFLADIRADARAQEQRIRARGGPTQARRLTHLGGVVRSPVFDVAHDDTLLFAAAPPNGGVGVYAVHAPHAQVPTLVDVVRLGDVGDATTVPAAGRAADTRTSSLVLSLGDTLVQGHPQRDLFVVDEATPDARRPSRAVTMRALTRGARLRSPAAIPRTRHVVAEHRTATHAALVDVDIDTGVQRELLSSDDGTLFYTPAVSPDGRFVACSRWQPGGARDIVELDLSTGATRVLDDNDAQDLDPGYTPDGVWVLFASDREDTFSIYAVRRRDGEVRRVVDTLGLATQPLASPDGRAVLYVDTHIDGQDIYAAPLDLARAPIVQRRTTQQHDGAAFAPVPATTRAATTAQGTSTTGHPTPTAMAPSAPVTTTAVASATAYEPSSWLLPRAWLPVLGTGAAGGLVVGASMQAGDPVGMYEWSARASWDFGWMRPRLSTTLRLLDLYLPLSIAVDLRPTIDDEGRLIDGVAFPQATTTLAGSLALAVPFRHNRSAHTIFLSAQRSVRVDESGFTSPPDAAAPELPASVTQPVTSTLGLDWSVSSLERDRDSVWTERGWSALWHLRWGARELGSDVDVRETTLDISASFPIVGLGNHVLSIEAVAGLAVDDEPGSSFFLGGYAGRDALTDVVTGARAGPGLLRGHPAFLFGGDVFMASTLAWRMPLLEIERGIETLPLYANRLSGALFVDAGFASAPLLVDLTHGGIGVGAELTLQATLGYYGTALLRVGAARGLTRVGIEQGYVVVDAPW